MDSRTRKIAIWTPVFLAFTLIIGILLGINLQSRKLLSVYPRELDNNNKLGVIMNLIEGNYVDSVDSKKIVESRKKSMESSPRRKPESRTF